MITEYRCTIDTNTGNFIRLIPVVISDKGEVSPKFINDHLSQDEDFVHWNTHPLFVRAIWDGTKFSEGATSEEIEEWEKEQKETIQEGGSEISRIAQVELALMELAEIVGGL